MHVSTTPIVMQQRYQFTDTWARVEYIMLSIFAGLGFCHDSGKNGKNWQKLWCLYFISLCFSIIAASCSPIFKIDTQSIVSLNVVSLQFGCYLCFLCFESFVFVLKLFQSHS